tara:strand:- start:8696 stop:10321 length:1626 start_codon:yes stop_codon:yes gene_type:complete
MNGIDTFLDINNAHLRVNSGNVQASTFVLDQINIVTSANTATTVNFNNVTKAFNAASNIEVGTANLFVDTTTSKVGIGTDAPAYTLDVRGTANVGALTATTFSGSGAGLTALDATNIASGTLDAARIPDLDAAKITGGTLNVDRIPDLDAAKITGGTLDAARIPDLNAANITSGTLDAARIPTLNQSTTGSAGSAATLTTPRSIGGVNFNGSADITPTTFTTATFSGDVGIKRTTARASLDVDGQIFSDWGSSGTSGFVIYNSGPYQMGLKQGNRQLELYTKTPDGDGDIRFKPNDVEKMVIKHGGNVGINKTNPGYVLDVHSDDAIHIEQAGNTTFETKIHGGALFIRNPSTSSGYEHVIINNHTTGNHTTSYIQFRRGNTGNGGAIGTISGNGSTISYGGQSDYRVKENIVPMPISGLDTINNLQPKRFNFIGHPDDIYDGFIAHELQEHIPMAVTGVKDEMRDRGNVVKIDDESFIVKEDVSEPDSLEEGTKWVKLTEEPVYQNVDLSKIVTYLVKAVQELSGENQTLKTRLDALENA